MMRFPAGISELGAEVVKLSVAFASSSALLASAARSSTPQTILQTRPSNPPLAALDGGGRCAANPPRVEKPSEVVDGDVGLATTRMCSLHWSPSVAKKLLLMLSGPSLALRPAHSATSSTMVNPAVSSAVGSIHCDERAARQPDLAHCGCGPPKRSTRRARPVADQEAGQQH